MRERRTFAERTKVLKSDEGKRKFFLVYEGASTEEIYFNALDNSGVYTDKNPLIELVPLIRSYSEDGWSNLFLCQDLVQVKMRNFSHFNLPKAQP